MSNLANVQILITVPHADCRKENKDSKKCDRTAFLIASSIRSELEKNNIMPYFYANTDISRDQMDMNKISARNEHFRQSISEVLKYLYKIGGLIYIFDIHSFSKKGKYPIFLIIHNTIEIIDQATSLASYLSIQMGFKVGVYIIADDCDIINEAHSTIPKAYPFLIQVNENVS